MAIANYIIDLDGTIYRGKQPIPYAKEFIECLNRQGRKFLLLTNCPSKTPRQVVEKLNHMDIHVQESNIFTSGQATASYISGKGRIKRIYVVGGDALISELAGKGLQIVEEEPDCVVVGYDTDFSYEKMRKAAYWIKKGALFIATNGETTVPREDAEIPHTGAILSSIEAASGIQAVIVGKPEMLMLDEALKILKCGRCDCCIIGDRLDTDILLGVRSKVKSYLVLTGIAGTDQVEKGSIKPDAVFENLKEVMEYDNLN